MLSANAISAVARSIARLVSAVSQEAVHYDTRFAISRTADWVTFGGIYLRRHATDAINGPE